MFCAGLVSDVYCRFFGPETKNVIFTRKTIRVRPVDIDVVKYAFTTEI